jgi:predicted Zn finger-like uncharacterized protein
MIIVCQNCECRFRVDDGKVPSGSFTVACPKCQTTVSPTAPPNPRDNSATAVGKSPSTSHPRFNRAKPAPVLRMEAAVDEKPASTRGDCTSVAANELALSLISLLKPEKFDQVSQARPVWVRRRVLVCTASEYRERIAADLTENGYEVFIADDTQQAVERMRESRLDVVILDQSFDPQEQGVAFVTREVHVLRPAQRRRVFFVSLASSKRTMDAHAAFLQNVNAIVNLNELDELPRILERSIREFNELYKDFNAACGVAQL